jgi:hypothetical protein
MAVKRKATSDVFPGQDVRTVTTNTRIKRLSLGWGAWEKYHQHGQDLARKGKYEEAIQVLSEVGVSISFIMKGVIVFFDVSLTGYRPSYKRM